MDVKEESPHHSSDAEYEDAARKRKSKSPSLLREPEPKRVKEDHEDIAKQYKRFRDAPRFNLNSEELYCVCRQPDRYGELMISCDGCEEWFHFKCMKINPNFQKLVHKFFCKFCQWKGTGRTRWHRKCRTPGCGKPINQDEQSKYCSHECGVRFLKSALVGSQQLSKGDIKFVITHCETYDEMVNLGQEFPELPEVLLLEMEKLPLHIREQLEENDKTRGVVEKNFDASRLKAEYFVKVKEKVKIINEKLQERADPEEGVESVKKGKKKKSKSKKVDICCFDERLNDSLDPEEYDKVVSAPSTYEAFKDEIDAIVAAYTEDGFGDFESPLCLQDRRKCIRHNGWVNLISDRIWKELNELQAVLDKLAAERADTLREYSTLVYERDS